MRLTRVEREQITDSVLNIQSARTSLEGIQESKVPDIAEIENCLKDADMSLRQVLRGSPAAKKNDK